MVAVTFAMKALFTAAISPPKNSCQWGEKQMLAARN